MFVHLVVDSGGVPDSRLGSILQAMVRQSYADCCCCIVIACLGSAMSQGGIMSWVMACTLAV
jgi:hypothetical protein